MNVAPLRTGAITNKKDAMNAHILRKWSSIKIFMYLLLTICSSLLVFWCPGASAMHLQSLDTAPSTLPQNYFLSLIRNASIGISHPRSQHFQSDENNNLKLQKLWQMRMREKRLRIQAHRKEKLLLQRLLDGRHGASPIETLSHDVIQHHQQSHLPGTSQQHLYDMLNEIRANISVASNRNRRESRFHHSQHQHHNHHQQHQMPSNNNNNNNLNNNNNSNNVNNNRGNRRNGRRRYCSARDSRTLAFEAPTVFEGKIKSMTLDRQQNFSATVEIIQVYKQQANFKLPKQVRLQFAYKNASECDIYREEFRHRGFVRDELEQGRIYFFFVKQIGLGNFTILGQPIKKINRTTKDVEIGVSEKYGE